MTLEQFYEAQKMKEDEFIICCENPDFEESYYAWVDYLTVLRLQEQRKEKENERTLDQI